MASNKYCAKKADYDIYTFDSKKEKARYKDLKLLQYAGEISNLTVHPKFVLLEGFIWRGRTIRPITYTADFRYTENGEPVIEDVKGGKATQTELFKVKVKLLKKKYPNLDFRTVEE